MLSIEINKVVRIKRNPNIFPINVKDIRDYNVSNYVRGIRLSIRRGTNGGRWVGETDL